jgi:peptidyl-prolyl cis-trans isomerase D
MGRDLTSGKKRDPAAVARAGKAHLDTLTLVGGAPPDSLFPPALVDSLLAGQVAATIFHGPRRWSRWDVFWRVDYVDTTFTPSFEAARSRVERGFNEARRAQEEEEARAHFDAHRANYLTQPKFVLEYVRVPILPKDSVAVSEEEIRRFHEERSADRFRQEEEVRARHILISTRKDLSEAAARVKADSIRKAIVDGADFSELAKTRSDDPGSAVQGGDLGFFPRGRMVKEFSDTSFALPVGGLSQPVKTQFGFHLIRVEERKQEGVRPLAEVRNEIHTELAQARAESLAHAGAESIRKRIPRVGVTVAASAYGGVKTTPPVAVNEVIPGLGNVPELVEKLPQLPVGEWASEPYREATSWLVLRVTQRVPPGPAEFTEVRRQAIEDMKNEKKRARIADRTTTVRATLGAGAPLDSAAAAFGGLKDSGLLTRSAGFVPFLGAEPQVVQRAFAMKVGQTSDSIHVATGSAWIRVDERKTVDGATFEADRDEISRELLAKNMEDWLERKKKTVRIEVLREDLKGPPPSRFKTVTTTIGG